MGQPIKLRAQQGYQKRDEQTPADVHPQAEQQNGQADRHQVPLGDQADHHPQGNPHRHLARGVVAGEDSPQIAHRFQVIELKHIQGASGVGVKSSRIRSPTQVQLGDSSWPGSRRQKTPEKRQDRQCGLCVPACRVGQAEG